MSEGGVAFVGPKGSGKTTTAIEIYHRLLERNDNAVYIDLIKVNDEQYKDCSGSRHYIIIDNAQLLKRDSLINIMAILDQGVSFILAFSSTLVHGEGNSVLRCPITAKFEFEFVPFTAEEVRKFETNCADGRKFDHETTLPYVVDKCLLRDGTYDDILDKLIQDIFTHLTSRLGINGQAAHAFKLLYSWLHVQGKMAQESINDLKSCGLVYKNANNCYQLVHERGFIFRRLCQEAEANHILFSQYDIGGAEELYFSDCCRRGVINAVCLGSCRTITGRNPKCSTLSITCNKFVQQSTIGGNIPISLAAPTCCLVKLAHRHPAIDFIIYQSNGSASSKILYFIQVSAQKYQERGTKLKAVLESSSDLNHQSPYTYYKNLFHMPSSSSEIFYIFSTTTQIPLTTSFTTDKRDKNRVYFHQL